MPRDGSVTIMMKPVMRQSGRVLRWKAILIASVFELERPLSATREDPFEAMVTVFAAYEVRRQQREEQLREELSVTSVSSVSSVAKE